MKTKCVKLLLALVTALSAGNLSAASVAFDVTNLGGNSYRYNYSVSGVVFLQNQELDIRFDPALYGSISNGAAPSGFDLLLLQPNNPPGTFGDYSAMALLNGPSLAGIFRVDVVYLGGGQPGSQPFFINQLDANGALVAQVTSGNSTQVGGPVPEPAGWTLAVAGLLIGGLWRAVRRRPA